MTTTVLEQSPAITADWRDFVALTKPRVMTLVVFTGLCGLLVAPAPIHPVLAFTAILCIALGAGAAAALNQWYEADLDALMKRTRNRPLPAGRMERQSALHFGVGLGVFSVLLMGLATNWFAALILAVSILFYVFVYTIWLKRRTPQNIVIGGAAGAFPPMIGWAAATGTVSLESVILFLIIFLWTPPHFWALALFKSEDYARAGIPMMPNVAGEASTRRQIFVYSLLIAPVGVLPAFLGSASVFYGIVAAGLGAGFVWYAWKVLGMRDEDRAMKPAKALFGYSLLYLFAIFAVYLADIVIQRATGFAGV